jgi:C-terminal processing protease CtpA/Prc
MTDYSTLVNTIVKIIRTKGIPVYIDRFNRLYIEDSTKFTTETKFMDYVNKIIHFYHPHSFLYKRSKTSGKKNTETEFSFGSDKIGKIDLFSFTSHNGPAKYELEKKKYISEIHDFLDMATEHGMKGLIIDFTKHGGGGIWQTLEAFKRYFNNTTLFAWSNSKVSLTAKKWTNMENNVVVWNRRFLTKDLNTSIPIAIIVGKETASAGEIVASMFKSSSNVRVFGERTKGLLSMNSNMEIGDFDLIFTSILQTSKDGSFNEYLDPDVKTKRPISDAKKWINSF